MGSGTFIRDLGAEMSGLTIRVTDWESLIPIVRWRIDFAEPEAPAVAPSFAAVARPAVVPKGPEEPRLPARRRNDSERRALSGRIPGETAAHSVESVMAPGPACRAITGSP